MRFCGMDMCVNGRKREAFRLRFVGRITCQGGVQEREFEGNPSGSSRY